MAGVGPLLAAARAAGMEVRVEADDLVVRGTRRHEGIARRLLAEKPLVLALLAEEAAVAWRVAAMGLQVPATGPIPFLVARAGEPAPGRCCSCGDPITPPERWRCGPCARATRIAIAARREGVRP